MKDCVTSIEKIKFRDASFDDLPAIVEIYNSTVPSRMVTADTEAVSVESRVRWFHEHTPGKRPLWVIEDAENKLVGWMSLHYFYGRPAYNGTAEMSIYIKATERGKGLGKASLRHCIEVCPSLGIKTLLGFIFAHNLPSLKLFNSLGFMDWGMLPDIATLDGVERSVVIVGKRIAD